MWLCKAQKKEAANGIKIPRPQYQNDESRCLHRSKEQQVARPKAAQSRQREYQITQSLNTLLDEDEKQTLIKFSYNEQKHHLTVRFQHVEPRAN